MDDCKMLPDYNMNQKNDEKPIESSAVPAAIFEDDSTIMYNDNGYKEDCSEPIHQEFRRPPGPSDLSKRSADGPVQPVFESYFPTVFGNRKRSFCSKWFSSYPWLEYSVSRDAAFCFACRHFTVPRKKCEGVFTNVGYKNWKGALGKDSGFPRHENSRLHGTAMISWCNYKTMRLSFINSEKPVQGADTSNSLDQDQDDITIICSDDDDDRSREECDEHTCRESQPPPGPGDISTHCDDGPVQPILESYAKTIQGGNKRRAFRPNWFSSFPWLEYSASTDSAFCFVCRHFPVPGKNPEPAFTRTGYKNWKKANCKVSGFPRHENSRSHRFAMISWCNYKPVRISDANSVIQIWRMEYAKQMADFQDRAGLIKVEKIDDGENPPDIKVENVDDGENPPDVKVENVDHVESLPDIKIEENISFSDENISDGNSVPIAKSGHIQGKGHVCFECGKCFRRADKLRNHLRVHSGEKPFACELCGKCFSRSDKLKRHQLTHSTTTPFICETCGKKFKDSVSLRYHMRIHSDQRPFSCEECGRRFVFQSKLKRHILTHSGYKPFKCESCSRCFPRKSALQRHMNTHTGVKPYACSMCDKKFANKTNLDFHSVSHNEFKHYDCNKCEMQFTLCSQLAAHKRQHRGEVPYSCVVCDRKFAFRTQYTHHMRKHTGEKPFNCEVCQKKFSLRSTLVNHMTIHTGEKRFVCTICGKRYSKSNTLNRHMAMHSGVKPYLCDICCMSFARRYSLTLHLRKHSNGLL